MSDHEISGEGVSRRDVMRRGAVVGGSLLWATPVVQSLGGKAFAQAQPGSPGGQEDCDELWRFKIDREENPNGDFDSGDGGTDCKPDGYSSVTNLVTGTNWVGNIGGHGTVTVDFDPADDRCAKITITGDCELLDGDAKAGSNANLECDVADPVVGFDNVYRVCLNSKGISHVSGVICCRGDA